MRIETTAKNLTDAITTEWNKTHKEDAPEVTVENMRGETINMKDITIDFVTIPEVTLDEYAEQLGVSNEEALAILDADVPIDDHLDTALELD